MAYYVAFSTKKSFFTFWGGSGGTAVFWFSAAMIFRRTQKGRREGKHCSGALDGRIIEWHWPNEA